MRITTRATIAAAVFGWASIGGLDRLGGMVLGAHGKVAHAEAVANTPTEAVWIVDADGDGVGDYANPTHGFIRGEDAYGSGGFMAARDGGKRKHHGVDYVAAPGDWVEAPIAGVVVKQGFAYKNNTDLRYVEIKNETSGMTAKVLYLNASVGVGQTVAAGEIIGSAQDLSIKYAGITNHVHVELDDGHGRLLDPATLLPLGEETFAAASTIVRSPS